MTMSLTQITTGGVDENINIDSNTLKVDGTNNRVGVGTASPGRTLDVAGSIRSGGSTNPFLALNDNTTEAYFEIASSVTRVSSGTSQPLAFRIGSSEKARIDSSGRVGIGTSSPSYTTHINSTGATSLGVTTSSSSSEPQILLEDTAANDYFALQKDGRELTFKPQGAEAVRIDGAGRLLVGTSPATHSVSTAEFAGTNSSYVFSLTNTTASDSAEQRYSYLAFTGTQSGGEKSILASVNGAHDGAADDTKGILVFRTNNGSEGGTIPTERMRIDSSGRLLVGTTSADSTYEGFVAVSSTAQIGMRDNGDGGIWTTNDISKTIGMCAGGNYASGSGFAWIKFTPSTTASSVGIRANTNGVELLHNATSWTALSDERTKTDFVSIDNALAKVLKLRAVTGRYKTDSESVRRSFLIAQDVQKVLPEAVNNMEGENDMLGLQYTEVIPLLVAALKESAERIENLEQRLSDAGIA